jgi:hypothetical protein
MLDAAGQGVIHRAPSRHACVGDRPVARRHRSTAPVPGRLAIFVLVMALGLLALPSQVAAEFSFEREIAGIPVVDGQPIQEPFTGGLDSPKPNLFDIDDDNDLDLLIVQPDGGITYYRNDSTPQPGGRAGLGPASAGQSAFAFHFVADELQGIDAATWATLADIDADGDLDLFTDGIGSVVFYRNSGSASQPLWQLESTSWQGITNSGFGNTPSLVDLDGDFDLDYLEMEQNFGTARFYRNDGTPEAPSLTFVTDSFGCIDTFIGFTGSAAGTSSDLSGDQPGAAPGPARAVGSPQHGISVISTADIDADLDPDIFIGDLFNDNLWYFRAEPGACSPPCSPPWACYQEVTATFLPLSTLGINQARFGDLDGDSDLDLIVGVTSQGASIDNLIHFQNTGTPESPSYVTVDLNLIRSVDIGSSSHPAFADVDGDGDQDLFIGAEDGTIAHFMNTGSRAAPSFVRQPALADATNAAIDVGFAAAPVWIDHEGDGDLDLFAGTGSPARVRFYRNDGTPAERSLVLVDPQFGNIQVDFNAAPSLGDLDDDGDLDLVVGEFGVTANPRLFYVRNDGTTGVPIWVIVSDNTANTFIFAQRVFDGDLAPELVDLDDDGDLDLLVGEREGNLNFYRNTGTPQAFLFTLESEAFAGAGVGRESASAVADVTGDGWDDLFVGEMNGGLNFYRRVPPIGVSDPGPVPRLAPGLITVVPNPTRGGAELTFELAAGARARIGVYTAGGRLVRLVGERWLAAGRHRLAWDGRDRTGSPVAAGIYLVRLDVDGRSLTSKISITP